MTVFSRQRSSAAILLGAALLAVAPAAAETAKERLAAMRRSVDEDPLLAGINKDEALVSELSAAVLAPWRRAWLERSAAGFEALAEGEALRFGWESCRGELLRERDGIREYDFKCGADAGKGQAGRYLSGFLSLESFTLEPVKVVPGETLTLLHVRYDLRGITVSGARRQDRGELRLSLTRNKSWKLTAISSVALESLEAEQASFEDVSALWGLSSLPVYERKEAIRRGGYAVAVSDYDSDGRPDLLVGGSGPLKLLRNTGDGFSDVTASAGLRGETLVKSAVFADMDNDGQRDIVLLRFVVGDEDKVGDFVAYRNVGGGRFKRAGTALTRTRRYDRTMPLTVADFNLDGRLDLYLGFPGTRDFTTLGRGPQELATQGVWLNDGRWKFSELGRESGLYGKDNIYPHSAIATDLDGDGRPDLVVMNDRAGLSPLYRNRPDGRFEEVSRQSGLVNESWAMTAAAGDYDGDGFTDLALTNIDFSAGRRILAGRAGRESGSAEIGALSNLARHLVGNRLFRNRGDGTFEETTDRAGIRWAGEAAAGAEWVDYNNDGHLDLYIMNGLWTGGSDDIASLFIRLHAHRERAYAETAVANALNSPLAPGDEALEGPNPLLEMLRAESSLSMAGAQRNRLFRNNGDGTFTELGFLAGVDRVEDGYVAAAADFDRDGRQDLILRNGDPAPGVSYPAVLALRNRGAAGRSLTVFVEGRRSNRDGYGATVTCWLGARRLVREVRGVTGASQSEPAAFFGLGSARSVDRLEVRWPSGIKEEFEGVAAGRIVLREGQGYVSLAARR